ncbi:MAG: class I SAM-dependent methyltransferase, partial [Solirubrobacteraceae bacterium]
MRWLAKAAIQGGLSLIPGGRRANYFMQRNVSKRLPRSDADFDFHAATAARHLAALDRARPGSDRSVLRCYEFGAGWDLIGPMAMWALGIENQTLVDIEPNVKLELVNDTIARFAKDRTRLEHSLEASIRSPDDSPLAGLGELATRFGITYLAPQDARDLPLPDGTVDFVSSTFTLEHIPPEDIAAILRETRRVMAPEAMISSLIDMQDHYNYIDSGVSVYNYLRYPAWRWRFLNPSLQPQNRLRHSQYLRLFDQAGL